jgi:polar amino acid transport system substrate-binding protein
MITGLLLLPSGLTGAQPLQIVTEEFPPYNYTRDGKLTGLSTEVVQAVVELLDIPANIKAYPWARAYMIAQQEPNTLIFSIGRSAEREHLFQWAGTVAPVQTCLFALQERTDIQFDSLEEARRYYIITQLKGRTAQRLVKLGFVEGQNLFSTISVNSAFLMLRSGRGDLLGYPELVLYHAIKKTGLTPESAVRQVYCFPEVSELYAAFSLQTSPEVVADFQNGLATIKANGTYQSILDKYLY